MFTEEGEVRKVSEDLVHGILEKGGLFINRSGRHATAVCMGEPTRPNCNCVGASRRRAC